MSDTFRVKYDTYLTEGKIYDGVVWDIERKQAKNGADYLMVTILENLTQAKLKMPIFGSIKPDTLEESLLFACGVHPDPDSQEGTDFLLSEISNSKVRFKTCKGKEKTDENGEPNGKFYINIEKFILDDVPSLSSEAVVTTETMENARVVLSKPIIDENGNKVSKPNIPAINYESDIKPEDLPF